MLEILGFITVMIIGIVFTIPILLMHLVQGNFGSSYELGEHSTSDRVWALILTVLIGFYWYLVYAISPIEIIVKG